MLPGVFEATPPSPSPCPTLASDIILCFLPEMLRHQGFNCCRVCTYTYAARCSAPGRCHVTRTIHHDLLAVTENQDPASFFFFFFFHEGFKLKCVICQPKHHAATLACNLNKHPFNTFQTAEQPLPSWPPCLRKSQGENASRPQFFLTYLFTPLASSCISPPPKILQSERVQES